MALTRIKNNIMAKIILGLTGKIGSGKDTVAKYLIEKYGGQSFSYSDALKEVLVMYDLPITRENQQKLSTLLRQNFSEDVLANAMEKKVNDAQGPIVAITNVRREADVADIRKLPNFFLIYVEASQQIRFQRYIKRNQSTGDTEMTMEEFLAKDNAESESQIDGLKTKANFVITNNGTLDELNAQIEDVWNKINNN
jgi:dephospho-CoA kinase